MQKKHFPLNPPNNLTIIFENKPDRDRIPYSQWFIRTEYRGLGDRCTEEKGTVVLLVPVVVEEGEVVEVALVVSTSPNNFRGVGEGQRDAVDAKEDEVGVYEIFHEAEAHLILFDRS